MADFADAFAGAGEFAAKLLDEAALSEEWWGTRQRKLLRFLPIVRKLNEFVLSSAC